MEKRQLRGSVSKTDDWIKCQSKKRPGQWYMFNKATGETKWCSEFVDNDAKPTSVAEKGKAQSPPKCIAKPLRTPAQDRLKRLQHNLKTTQKDKLPQKQAKARRGRSQDKDIGIERENKIDDSKKAHLQKDNKLNIKSKPSESKIDVQKDFQPSTSKSALSVKMEKDENVAANTTPQKLSSSKNSKQSSPKKEVRKRPSSNFDIESITKPQKRAKQESESKVENTPKNEEENDEKNQSQRTTAALGIGSGIVNKIKAICKSTFSSYCNAKKALSQKPLEPCIKKTNFKIPKKETVSRATKARALKSNGECSDSDSEIESDATPKRKTASSAPMAIVMKGIATPSNGNPSVDFKAFALTASPSQLFGTPSSLVVPTYERGSANTRLERLRNSLRQHAIDIGEESSTPTRLCASACSSALACVIRDNTMEKNNPAKVDDEPMDWMPIEDLKTETIEISSNESSNAEVSVSGKEPETMGEYYGTVNENLLRYAVEQKNGANTADGKWLNDYYYFVLDTNVLLRHLTFIEELSHMKLCDTSGTVLYLPYSVLQELDKLKQFAVGDGTKVLAVRAIKYLNAKFEAKNKHLQAQSAISEREHLVEISSPDDRIINCCLQAKQHVDHVILLTEDINLRNKAICNNILVSTKSDLVVKHT
ncbi:LOW QUALITY PROTEIN: transcriptional protein SWT1 [Rhagoletis pomonella]|uniref:LOW QUALITY PROTEIN: transcriptional protein SWT1 n=1 Tax=Rhagoletis pomonella TaxID=28610 RepID=UPI0017853E8D|nr:LOW QUALITY PROTEIN: transcriptional protein SWT1 [Rhagoletis pomonella]